MNKVVSHTSNNFDLISKASRENAKSEGYLNSGGEGS